MSDSRRCVTCRDVPGLRRSSSRWMSGASSAMPGGQPSTTQPIAGPCDSPNEVTQNSVPSVLPDMGRRRGGRPTVAHEHADSSHGARAKRIAHASRWHLESDCAPSCRVPNRPPSSMPSVPEAPAIPAALIGRMRKARSICGADRRRDLGGIRRADVSRRADRHVGAVRSARARHAGRVPPQREARLGLVCMAPRAGRRRGAQCRTPRARGDRGGKCRTSS